MAGKGNLQSTLVGRFAVPAKIALERDASNRKAKTPVPELWPLAPNNNGHHFGEIVAAWLEESNIRIQVIGPNGDTAKIWLHSNLIDIYKDYLEVDWERYAIPPSE